MKIIMAADHGGFALKQALKSYLEQKDNYQVIDLGTDSEESVDYPDFGRQAAEKVIAKEAERGIIICGTGIGISIAANKVNGARAALCHSVYDAVMTRKHNDSNLLALGGRTTTEDIARTIVDAWLETDFEGGRHQRRVDKIES